MSNENQIQDRTKYVFETLNQKNIDAITSFSDDDLKLLNKMERTPLIHLCASKPLFNLKIFSILINKNPEINVEDEYGHTALYYAARNGFTVAVDILISRGAVARKEDIEAVPCKTGNKYRTIKKKLGDAMQNQKQMQQIKTKTIQSLTNTPSQIKRLAESDLTSEEPPAQKFRTTHGYYPKSFSPHICFFDSAEYNHLKTEREKPIHQTVPGIEIKNNSFTG